MSKKMALMYLFTIQESMQSALSLLMKATGLSFDLDKGKKGPAAVNVTVV